MKRRRGRGPCRRDSGDRENHTAAEPLRAWRWQTRAGPRQRDQKQGQPADDVPESQELQNYWRKTGSEEEKEEEEEQANKEGGTVSGEGGEQEEAAEEEDEEEEEAEKEKREEEGRQGRCKHAHANLETNYFVGWR